MMVSVGSSGDYPSLYGEQETSESIETEKGALTDICWLIPASGRPMSLGRNQSADISIPEYSVSADHGVLAWKRSKGLTIVDNAASNGIWIESENLRKLEPSEVYIFEGDERIMLGRFVFRFSISNRWSCCSLGRQHRRAKRPPKSPSRRPRSHPAVGLKNCWADRYRPFH